jgi:hypothetical protein
MWPRPSGRGGGIHIQLAGLMHQWSGQIHELNQSIWICHVRRWIPHSLHRDDELPWATESQKESATGWKSGLEYQNLGGEKTKPTYKSRIKVNGNNCLGARAHNRTESVLLSRYRRELSVGFDAVGASNTP